MIRWLTNLFPSPSRVDANGTRLCECRASENNKKHCRSKADYLVRRKGRQIAVCGNCTLTGDQDFVRYEE